MKWSDLKDLIGSPFFQIGSFAMIYVPIIAFLVTNLREPIFLAFAFCVEFPSSLVIIYFSSVFFVIGSITHRVLCPTVIKKHDGYFDFQRYILENYGFEKQAIQELKILNWEQTKELVSKLSRGEDDETIKKATDLIESRITSEVRTQHLRRLKNIMDQVTENYWRETDHVKPLARNAVTSLIFAGVGLAFVAVILFPALRVVVAYDPGLQELVDRFLYNSDRSACSVIRDEKVVVPELFLERLHHLGHQGLLTQPRLTA